MNGIINGEKCMAKRKGSIPIVKLELKDKKEGNGVRRNDTEKRWKCLNKSITKIKNSKPLLQSASTSFSTHNFELPVSLKAQIYSNFQSPKFGNSTAASSKRSSIQNLLKKKQLTDDVIAPEDEEELNLTENDISTRGDTDMHTHEMNGKGTFIKILDEIRVPNLSLEAALKISKKTSIHYTTKPANSKLAPSYDTNEYFKLNDLKQNGSPTKKFMNTTKIIPCISIQENNNDLSPLNYANGINEAENSDNSFCDSISSVPRRTIKKNSSNNIAACRLDNEKSNRERAESYEDRLIEKIKLRHQKASFEVDSEYEIFNSKDCNKWLSEFDDSYDNTNDILNLCFTDINTKEMELNKFEVKYLVLSEFMSIKAEEIRNSKNCVNHNRSLSQQSRNSVTNALNDSDDIFDHLKKEASGEEYHPVYQVRKSVKLVKPMNTFYLSEFEELASNKISTYNSEDLIGFIDPLGCFCINEGFDKNNDRLLNEQLEEFRNSFFDYDPIKQWKREVQTSFLIIFEIINNEVNKLNKNYLNYSKYISKIFKYISELNSNFNQYFECLEQKIYSVPIEFKPTIKNIISSILD